MTFRVKAIGARRRPESPAQAAARARSFRIFQLRGLWFQCGHLSGERLAAAQAAVDAELAQLGAEPQGERRARERADLETRLAADAGQPVTQAELEMPF